MEDFGGIKLILVQTGRSGKTARLFFTKNVKGKEIFLNYGSDEERCIHDV
jgi:hypothetical protein